MASPESLARFQREARVLSKLRHPNIVRLFTVGRVGERCYFTMDYVDGVPLSSLIQKSQN